MCGIVAIISSGQPVAPEAIHEATAALRHRGPDGQGVWCSPDGRVALGHRLLGISTPDGAQPIASEDGSRVLIANGEFYDFATIRRGLLAHGHRFGTDSDSEIALHLYEDLGPACLEHLRGEFAFVLWDGASGTVFAARDRFGIKPLFYARHDGALLLASEAKSLFAAGLPAIWDDEAVYQQLHGCFHSDRSLFAGVHQIPPGHYLAGTAESFRLVSYWDIDFPRKSEWSAAGEEEATAQVRHRLTEAIRLRMNAHVPVGYLLSGGLDSTAVLSIAAAHSDRPVRAFTVGFDDATFDESAKARAAAAHVGADLDILRVTDADLADHFAETVRSGEGLQANAHGTARFLLSQAIQQAGYRAVMGGEGADELFAGYGFVRPAVLGGNGHGSVRRWGTRLLRLAVPLNDAERQIARAAPRLARLSRAVDLPRPLMDRFAGSLDLLHSVLAPDFVAPFAATDPYWTLLRRLDWRRRVWGREPAKQILYLWLRSIFVGYHMAADRLDMAHAVEVRLPFLDHFLFDYTARLPVSLLAKDGRQKHLLREAARPFVADSVYHGAKQPFYAPPSALRAGSRLHDFVQDTVRGESLALLPFFNKPSLLALMDHTPNLDPVTRATLEPLMMAITSLCLLDDAYRVSSGRRHSPTFTSSNTA